MTARLGRILISAAMLVVLLSLALAASRATWHATGLTAGAAVGPLPAMIDAPDHAAPDLEPILAFAPFGEVVVAAPAEPEKTEETSLQLVLHGLVVADAARQSIAYISSRERPIRSYGIGDPVADGAALEAVRHDHVVLRVDGRRELLYFPKPSAGAAANELRLGVQPTGGGSLPVAGSTPDEVIDFWRRRIADNPAAVLDQLGIVATDEGYQIGEQAHPGVRRAGFREGDVVASVNGQPVGDVERDRTLYDEIAAVGRARVELIRDGRTIVMSFPLR